MNKIKALCFALLTASAAFAASAVPAFNATLTVGKETRFVLIGADNKASSWLALGDVFDGYTLKAYDTKTSTLSLEKDGKETPVVIAADAKVVNGGPSTANTKATIADATALLDKLHFEQMLDKSLVPARKQLAAAVDRMVAQATQGNNDPEAVAALKKKLLDELTSAFSGSEMKGDVAKIYSEVFTKDDLQGISDFYSTPLGQTLADKQPEITEKMQAVLMPKMMALGPKLQQLTKDFAAEQKAKAAPTTPAPGGN